MSLPWSARLHATSPYARNILLRHGLRPKVSNDNQLDVEWSKEFPCVVISETNIQISMLLPLSQLARPHATTPNSNYTNFMEGSSTPAPKPWKPKDLSNQSITPPPSSTMLATTPKPTHMKLRSEVVPRRQSPWLSADDSRTSVVSPDAATPALSTGTGWTRAVNVRLM